jgi:predicted nucleic acid-binding protein
MELCEELLIPAAVAEEISRGPENDPANLWLQRDGKAFVKNVGSIYTVAPALKRLEQIGFRIDQNLVDAALQLVGEKGY